MLDFMNITKALTDENRVRILMALRGRELCVCQVTAFLDLAPSTISKHLSVLRQARLIESRKHGKWVYYTLAGEDAPANARAALAWVIEALAAHPAVRRDEDNISALLQKAPAGSNLDETCHSAAIHSLENAELDEQPA